MVKIYVWGMGVRRRLMDVRAGVRRMGLRMVLLRRMEGVGGEMRRNCVRLGCVCVFVSATVLNEGNKVHIERLPFQE